MENLSKTSNIRSMQRDLERERRRLRDRQRRQSMSSEQRERHLARRRRNYQLRRQRVGHPQLEFQCEQTSVTTSGEKFTGNDQQAVTSGLKVCIPCNGVVAQVGFHQGPEKLNVECMKKSAGFEALAHKLTDFPERVRLHHLRHLARFLKHPVDGNSGDNCQVVADLATKNDGTDCCRASKGLRLNQIKHLARGLNSSTTESPRQNHNSEAEG